MHPTFGERMSTKEEASKGWGYLGGGAALQHPGPHRDFFLPVTYSAREAHVNTAPRTSNAITRDIFSLSLQKSDMRDKPSGVGEMAVRPLAGAAPDGVLCTSVAVARSKRAGERRS